MEVGVEQVGVERGGVVSGRTRTDRGGAERPSPRPGAPSWPRRAARAARGLALACHPLPGLVVTVLVTALAAVSGRSVGGCVLVAVTVLVGELSVGWSNDAADADADEASGRTGKPIVAGLVGRRTVATAAGLALLVCVPLSFANGFLAGPVHLIAVAAAWVYNLRAKRTVLSWLPYVVAFGAYPAFVTLGLPDQPLPAWWGPAAGALLGVGVHLANVLPDVEHDLRTGVRGLPQRLGATLTRRLLPVPLLAATVALLLGPPGPPTAWQWAGFAVAVLLTAVATLVPLRPGSRGGARTGRDARGLPFAAALAVAVVAVAMLVAAGGSLA